MPAGRRAQPRRSSPADAERQALVYTYVTMGDPDALPWVNYILPQWLVRAVDRLGTRDGRSSSAIAQQALEEFLLNKEDR